MEDEIYELARQRVNRRNRQMYLLAANMLGLFIYLAAFAALGDVIPKGIGSFIAIAWVGAVGVHAMIFSTLSSRSSQIDAEVERLRQAIYDEKPKNTSRLELSDDGELVELDDYRPDDEAHQDSL